VFSYDVVALRWIFVQKNDFKQQEVIVFIEKLFIADLVSLKKRKGENNMNTIFVCNGCQ